MKLIVGLGNPGKNYDNTRHNTGFMFLDYFLDKKYTNINWKSKFNGLFYENVINDEKVIFLKPQSYMNLSGEVVSKYANFYKIVNYPDKTDHSCREVLNRLKKIYLKLFME